MTIPNLRGALLLAATSLALGGCTGLPSSGPTAKQVVRETQPDLNAMGMRIVEIDAGTITGLDAPITAAQAATTAAIPVTSLATLARQGRVDVVGAGDVLQVSIFEVGASLFSGGGGATAIGETTAAAGRGAVTGVAVDEDGAITIPYVGRLQVAGRTVTQIGQMIEAGLAGKSQSPQVVVTLAQNRASTVLVTGLARNPGRYTLSGARETLLDAIADAGGPAGNSAGGNADNEDILVRFTRDGRTVEVPLSEIRTRSGDDLVLLPRDRVELVRRERSYLVFGAAGRVAQQPFGAPVVSLAEAIARVGGPADNLADPTAVFVFRYAPGQDAATGAVPIIYRLNMLKPSSYFLSQRFAMRDKDVIYVALAGINATAKVVQIVNLLFSPITAAATTYIAVDRQR